MLAIPEQYFLRKKNNVVPQGSAGIETSTILTILKNIYIS
jgi:hypothetical protein